MEAISTFFSSYGTYLAIAVGLLIVGFMAFRYMGRSGAGPESFDDQPGNHPDQPEGYQDPTESAPDVEEQAL